MTCRRIVTAITVAFLGMLILGCAGTATETGASSAAASAAALCGTWHGSFGYSGDDNLSSWGSSGLTLQVGKDSTYALKWGDRPASLGTVAERGNRVILDDASGSQITLVHSGDTLYGVTRDSASGRPAVMSLEKQESATGRFAAIGRGCVESLVDAPEAQSPDSRPGAKPPVRARQR
jgi:hypothetical protein